MLVSLFFFGCSSQISSINADDEKLSLVEHSYYADMNSLDAVVEYSTNIVKANLISVEEFDEAIGVYIFKVEKDYTENTSDIIHMYDAYDKDYIKGHSYYLFLCSVENALYPHRIFTTVLKDFIADTSQIVAAKTINGADIALKIANADKTISEAVTKGMVGTRVHDKSIEITESTNMKVIAEEADLIAKIQLSEEIPINRYASQYTVVAVDVLKGPEEGLAKFVLLKPDLMLNTDQYVFLIEDPSSEGNYLLFSRDIQVVPASKVNTRTLNLE